MDLTYASPDVYLHEIDFGDKYFVAAGANGKVYIHEDSDFTNVNNWVLCYTNNVGGLANVKYANGLFVIAYRDHTNDKDMYSIISAKSNNLFKWKKDTLYSSGGGESRIKFVNGKWIVVGGGYSIYYSKNAEIWTEMKPRFNSVNTIRTYSQNIYDIEYVKGRFVGTSYYSNTDETNRTNIWYSNYADDISEITDWYPDYSAENLIANVDHYGYYIKYGNNVLVLGAGDGNTAGSGVEDILYCDGIIRNGSFNWHIIDMTESNGLGMGNFIDFYNGRFTIACNSDDIIYSYDGKNWNYISNITGFGGNIHGLAHGNNFDIYVTHLGIIITGSEERAIEIGNKSSHHGIVIGSGSKAEYTNSIAIGNDVEEMLNSIVIGNSDNTINTNSKFIVNGIVGIGTTSPSYKLHVIGDAYFNDSGSGAVRIHGNQVSFAGINDGNSNEDYAFIGRLNADLYIVNGNNYDNDIRIYAASHPVTYDGGSDQGRVILRNYSNNSDNRIKHNEEIITNALSDIRQLTPKKYWKLDDVLYDENHNFDLDTSGNPIDTSGNRVPAYIEHGLIAQEGLNIDSFMPFVGKPHANQENDTYTLQYMYIRTFYCSY